MLPVYDVEVVEPRSVAGEHEIHVYTVSSPDRALRRWRPPRRRGSAKPEERVILVLFGSRVDAARDPEPLKYRVRLSPAVQTVVVKGANGSAVRAIRHDEPDP